MRKQKLPNIINILILTVITVIFWIGLEVYRSLTTTPPPSVSPQVLAQLDATLDQQNLDKLVQRVYKETTVSGTTQLRASEGEVAPVVNLSTPVPTPIEIATTSATLSP